jgi:hypothetical protein
LRRSYRRFRSWDSFTYAGLPSGGASIEATLSLPGAPSGDADGMAWLAEGSPNDLPFQFESLNSTATPKPISSSFDVVDGETVTVFAEIEVSGGGLDSVANLGDPPTLDLTLPKGASVVTASDVFDNFTPAIPEPPG